MGSATWNRTLAAATPGRGFSSPLAGADFNVLIRTLECSEHKIELGIGGGITADSVATGEWDECLAKAAPLVSALGSDMDPDLRPPVPRSVTGNGPAGCWKRCWRSVHPCSGWQPTSPGSTARVVNCMAKGLRMILPRRSPPLLPAASTLPYAEWSG